MIVKQKIIFFFNTLERTGSEIFLFNLIDCLDLTKFEITIVCFQKAGSLKDDLKVEVKLIDEFIRFNSIDKIINKLGVDVLEKKIQTLLDTINPNICYFNTIGNLYLLKYIDQSKIKTIVHIHELSSNYSYITDSDFDALLSSHLLIACSDLVRQELVDLPAGKIEVINSCPLKLQKPKRSTILGNSSKIRIITSGSISFRKGTDLWLKIIQNLELPNLEFIWLGKNSKNGFARWIELTANKLSIIKNNFKFIEPQTESEYNSILASGNYFLSTSREESMGIAMMEAQLFGIPVIALNSGGSELIIRSTDYLISSYQIDDIIRQISHIIENNKAITNDTCNYSFLDEFKKWQNLLS
jgi:glycosyltransferase involved in cell wall biosynthesis